MTHWQYLHSHLITICMITAVSGLPQIAPAKSGSNEKVEILAVIDSPAVCIGTDHLRVRIMIINNGGEPVDLDVNRLSTTVGFMALIDTIEMKFRNQTLGVSSDPMGNARPPAIMLLAPKGFFEREIQLPIRDPFFNQAGFYRLNLTSSVRVGQSSNAHDVFSSSTAFFELRSCESQ